MKVAVAISPRDYDVVLFDLDGVLTRTASVHAAAWKKLFDSFLEQRATKAGTPFVPFDIETDYPRYVDGKPRYDGVAEFLESRGIELPLGAPEDGPDVQSVHALGSLKDRYFREQLEQHGVEPYEPAIALVRTLRAHEIKTAVVSSSNNCAVVLEAAGIAQLFDARVDGLDLTRLELDGKPAPDAFLEAARRVGAVPSRAVVVEDAIAGVAAGRAGGFGCVIGVDRRGHAQALRDAGANVVVTDMAQVQVAAEPSAAWSLVYEDFDVAKEGVREALCTLGNGYFATRGSAAGAVADGVHYPGPISPAVTIGCARTSPAGSSRTRTSSTSPTGSRSSFASARRIGSMPAPSSSCPTARSSICGVACCSGASASRTAEVDGVRSRSVAWSRWTACTSARSS